MKRQTQSNFIPIAYLLLGVGNSPLREETIAWRFSPTDLLLSRAGTVANVAIVRSRMSLNVSAQA